MRNYSGLKCGGKGLFSVKRFPCSRAWTPQKVPPGCTESGIVCEMSGIKNHLNAKSDCVCEGQFQMQADGFITVDDLARTESLGQYSFGMRMVFRC